MKAMISMLLTLVTLTVNGQHSLLGVRGGPNWTNVTATYGFNDNASRGGFSGGLTYEYLTDKHVSLGADLIYSQRGFANNSFSYTDNSGHSIADNVIMKFNYDYVSLPLKAGLNFGSKFYNFANIGVVPSWLVNAKTSEPEFDANGNITGPETTDVTSRVKKIDVAGLVEIGGGYKIQNKYWLFTSFTYQHSFTAITTADYFANSKIRHNGMTVSVGLKYTLTKE